MEQREYVRQVLEAYRSTSGTAGVVRRTDRLFANQLYERGVSLETVGNALTLAAARRSARPADERRPGILSAPPQQTPARHRRPVTPLCKLPATIRSLSARMTSSPHSSKSPHTPAAWMMMFAPPAILFLAWVISTERYWVTFRERRSRQHGLLSHCNIGST